MKVDSRKTDIVQTRLNELWAGIILSYSFDILRHTITFEVSFPDVSEKKNCNICFKDVRSYYFTEDIGMPEVGLTEYETGNYLELTSISYYPDGLGNINIDVTRENEWSKSHVNSNPNFHLEIWISELFIEAKCVVINNEVYEVGYS